MKLLLVKKMNEALQRHERSGNVILRENQSKAMIQYKQFQCEEVRQHFLLKLSVRLLCFPPLPPIPTYVLVAG